ncbi:MAG TPA: NUDIX hydrolase [Candidatus Saccharimonadales bacterium]|jgi:ADP-ribose pyrophosphatase
MKVWKRIEPTKVTKVGFRQIVTKTFEMSDGRIETFDIKERDGWAAVVTITLTPDNEVLILRQFRPGTETIMDELPGGMVEVGETDLEQVARRELEEETGYQAGRMSYFGKLSYDAYTNGWRHYFLAQVCTPTGRGQQLEPNETDGELQKIAIPTLFENARKGRMTDPGGVSLAYDKLQELQKL